MSRVGTPATTDVGAAGTSTTWLPDSHEAAFARDGYLVVPGLFTDQEVEALRQEATRLCRGELGDFIGSVDTSSLSDDEVLRRYLCIHFPHKLSPLMLRALGHPGVVATLTRLIGPNVKAMQSMLFIKSEGKPGQAWHQDEWFIPTRDRSLTAAWIALDDAHVGNGCLWVLPGSHQRGILWPQRDHNDRRFDCAQESFGFSYRDEEAVAVEVTAGSVVFFNGYLLHRSLPNSSVRGWRRALTNHYMSAESLLPWQVEGRGHVGGADYRDIVMVAGEDVYAWKGIEDLSEPRVRRDGAGGCLPAGDSAS
jgi:phytanoyl-CoA hydroxylase